MAKDLSFPNPEAHAAQFIEGLRDGTVIAPQNLLKILPVVFEQAIALIFSELDYERNLKCNTAIAVRILAIYAARVKDSKSSKDRSHQPRCASTAAKKARAQRRPKPAKVPSMSNVEPESVQTAQKILSLPSREKAIVMRIMTRFLNRPPGAGPITKEQVAGWLKAEGAAESAIYSYLKSMEVPVERSQSQP